MFCRFFAGNGKEIRCQEGIGERAAKPEQLRLEARSKGRKWLGSVMGDMKWNEVRELARAAELPVRKEDNVAWMPVGELHEALLEHLAPERSAAAAASSSDSVQAEMSEASRCCHCRVFVLCIKCFFSWCSGNGNGIRCQEGIGGRAAKLELQLWRSLLGLFLFCFMCFYGVVVSDIVI